MSSEHSYVSSQLYGSLETGSVKTHRKQEWVEIRGTFKEFPSRTIGCCCLIGPSSDFFRPDVCMQKCPVTIIHKRYHHCTERELMGRFLDCKRLNLYMDYLVSGPVAGYLSEDDEDSLLSPYV